MRIVHFIFIPLLTLSACRSAPAPAPTPAPKNQGSLVVGGKYRTGGDCAHGSPENPTCIRTLTLDDGGKATYIGDDIVELATWTQQGKRITVAIGTYSIELTVNDDGTLVEAHGAVWNRSP